MTVIRDAAWVQREYGRDKWPAIRARIAALLSTGERSLARVAATLSREEFGTPGIESMAATLQGRRVDVPAALMWHGFYALVAELVIAACRPETDGVVDLGAGWGRSLFDVWLRGGPRGARYCALEYTDAGLECAASLGALEPAMPLLTAHFDFTHPDFGPLPQQMRHAVLFSVSSAHQIPRFDVDAYRALAGVADSVDCLHFEQIGWQMRDVIGQGDRRGSGPEPAVRHDYNTNLWSVVSTLVDSGEVALVDAQAELAGTSPDYSMSFVWWRASRRA
ncbi:MAG: hypothetical protein AB7I25_01380 [Vicinamibacterales bacterium]